MVARRRLNFDFPAASVGAFAERFATDFSESGFVARTARPLPAGTSIRFVFMLSTGAPFLTGRGTVAWIAKPGGPDGRPGMGVRIDQLIGQSERTIERIITIARNVSREEGRPKAEPWPEWTESDTSTTEVQSLSVGFSGERLTPEPEPPIAQQAATASGPLERQRHSTLIDAMRAALTEPDPETGKPRMPKVTKIGLVVAAAFMLSAIALYFFGR